jgi:AcrR family transcriptional regulator
MARGDTKARMVDSAITLLRERGAAAVTLDGVLAHSGAPRGSVYHHFPGGRDELVLEAGRTAVGYLTALIDAAAETGDAVGLLRRLAEFWRWSLQSSDYQAGCPVVALSVDARDDLAEAGELARAAFAGWRERLAAMLPGAGGPAEAAALATLTVAAVEGAILLCRAQRDTEPLEQVIAQLTPLLAAAQGGGELRGA